MTLTILFLANTPMAIEVWMLYCIASTFLILLQNGLLMMIDRHLEANGDLKGWPMFKAIKPQIFRSGQINEFDAKRSRDANKNLVKTIDKISFGVCVASFVIFVILFWVVYAY